MIRFVNIALNINTGELIVDDIPNKLTAKEAQLLEMFIRNPGMTISKDQILDRIWGIESSVMENSVEIYVHYLRKKISKSKVYIKTIRGLGYVLGRRRSMFNLNRLRINQPLNTGVLIGLLLFIVIFLYMILSLDVENNVNGDLQIYCSQLANEIEFLSGNVLGEPVTEEEKALFWSTPAVWCKIILPILCTITNSLVLD